MYTLYFVLLFTALICHASTGTPIQNNTLAYECTKEGTIVITGQDKEQYGSIYAEGMKSDKSHSTCNVDRLKNGSVVIFTVRDCNVSLPVNVTVMNEQQNTTGDMIVGGSNVTLYEVKCADVRLGGLDITKSITIIGSNELTINRAHQEEVNMTMKLLDKSGNVLAPNKTVLIGDQLQLIIEANVLYAFLARSCIATDGNKSSAHSKQLIRDGESQDRSLIQSGSYAQNQTNRSFRASLYAFHFVNSYSVSIICNITVCKNDDKSCPFNISINIPRGKRSAPTEPVTHTMETSFRVSDAFIKTVHKTDDSNKSGDDLTDDSNVSGASAEQRSLAVLMILFAVFGFTRTLS